MNFSAKEMIKQRKSVRTFDGKLLSDEDRKKLENYIDALANPFGVPVAFKLLDAKEHDLSSPVIVGEHTYMTAKVNRVDHFEIGYGYSFENACLYALSLGLGTVMLAASLSRKTFEAAMNLGKDEVLPVASPVGYPAAKRSMRENMMRKGMKSDQRMDFGKLFFAGEFGKELSVEEARDFFEALEMARLAPSATNRQPWRAVVDDNKVHFFEAKTLKDSGIGDVQKVDVGIALCHFDLVMKENGSSGQFVFDNPGLELPENVFYVTTYERKL